MICCCYFFFGDDIFNILPPLAGWLRIQNVKNVLDEYKFQEGGRRRMKDI
jgi:hypothetical protein